MGWASAGEIFDPVARALVELNASGETKRRVLGPLIRKLKDGDWDTEHESLGEFADDPVIVDIFREHGVYRACDDEKPDGTAWCELEIEHVGDHRYDRDMWPNVRAGVTRWYRKKLPGGAVLAIGVEDPPTDDAPYTCRVGLEEMGLDKDDLWGTWALLGTVLGDEIPPAWAVGRIPATDVNGEPIEEPRRERVKEPLLDPDCRGAAPKHGSCFGGPCECECHRKAADDV